MGLFSAWNICCIFPMLILVDHKQVTPQPSFKQKNSTEFSVSYHKVFQISGCSCTFPWCLSNLPTSPLKCGLENGAERSHGCPVLLCTEINPGRGSSWGRPGHSAQQHHTRRWHSPGCSLSPLHLSSSPLVQGMESFPKGSLTSQHCNERPALRLEQKMAPLILGPFGLGPSPGLC